MEPVAILGAIQLSEGAYFRFCSDHGPALVEDLRYIKANADAERAYTSAIAELRQRFGEPSMSQIRTFMASHRRTQVLTPLGHFHHPRDRLIVRYLQGSTLFYFYVLELRKPDDMAVVPSFKALQNIAFYKDSKQADHVLFASATPDVPHMQIWRRFRVVPGLWEEMRDDAQVPTSAVSGLRKLAYDCWLTDAEESDDVDEWPDPSRMLSEPLLSILDAQPPL